MNPIILFLLMVLATQASAQPLATMVTELTADIKAKHLNIAVLEFSYAGGQQSRGPAVVQERITTALLRQKVGVVTERNLLNRVMGELRLQASGITDAAKAKQIGLVLGADVGITGTLNDVNATTTEVNARLIDVESAQVLSASVSEVPKTWGDVVSDAEQVAKPISALDYMNEQLKQLRKGIGTTINATGSGKVIVGGVTLTPDQFGGVVTDAMEAGLTSQGLNLPNGR